MKHITKIRIVPTLILLLVLAYSPYVSAQSEGLLPFTDFDLEQVDQKESFRDPNEIKKSANCQSPSGTAVDPGENAEAVWRFFADKLPGHQIAGIIGNMTAESGVQPQRLQGTPSGEVTPAVEALKVSGQNAKAWGLVQWDPNGKMIGTFADPSEADNITNQLTFLWSQLNGGTSSPEGPAGTQLKATTTIAEATEIFGAKYERPLDLSATLADRIIAAEAAFERFDETIGAIEQPVGDGDPNNTFVSACDNSDKTFSAQVAAGELAQSPTEFDESVLMYTDGNMEPWAASFVSWVFKESGREFTGGLSGGWRRPSVTDLQEMFKNEEGFEYFNVGDGKPRAGDVAFYIGDQTPDGGSTSHVNIVMEVNNNGTMVTIGGDEGNRVSESTQAIEPGENSLVGFGRKTN